jgi:hypothetical protein
MRSILTRASPDSSAEIDFVYLTGEKFAPRCQKKIRRRRALTLPRTTQGGTIPQARADPAKLFWRERGDDFFEARIAAQRIPVREQFQFSVGCYKWIRNLCRGR